MKGTDAEVMRALIAAHQEQLRAGEEVARLVAELRNSRRRVAWREIAAALGISPQGAQQRYREIAPKARRRPRRIKED